MWDAGADAHREMHLETFFFLFPALEAVYCGAIKQICIVAVVEGVELQEVEFQKISQKKRQLQHCQTSCEHNDQANVMCSREDSIRGLGN